MKPTCLSLDLDNTICYLEGGREAFLDIFAAYDIPRKQLEEIYNHLRYGEGFSPKEFLAALVAQGFTLDVNSVEKKLTALHRKSLKLYEDAAWLTHKEKTPSAVPIAIVTAGHPDYQQEKCDLLGIRADHIFVVAPSEGKTAPLRELIARYGTPIIHTDDKLEELDRIRDAGLTEKEVITIALLRDPKTQQKTSYTHRVIHSLAEILTPPLRSLRGSAGGQRHSLEVRRSNKQRAEAE